MGPHSSSVLEGPANDDAADLLAGGHLLQTGEGMRSRGGARCPLPREEDGIEGPGGRDAGPAADAAGMRGDGDADPIPVDVQGHDGPGPQGRLPVHQGGDPSRSHEVAAELRWRSGHDLLVLVLVVLAD